MQPVTVYQILQRYLKEKCIFWNGKINWRNWRCPYQLLVLDAIQPRHGNDQAYFCMVLYHNDVAKSHPIRERNDGEKVIFNLNDLIPETKAKLTSKLAKQYQQNTCLHRLHIIWAQPSSFSIGTEHIGQHLMRSLSNGMPMVSSSPMAAKRLIFSSQLRVWCHYKIRMFKVDEKLIFLWLM